MRVVKSNRAGVGKTLFKKRMVSELTALTQSFSNEGANNLTIPLHGKSVNVDEIMEKLLATLLSPEKQQPRIFHFDFSSEVSLLLQFAINLSLRSLLIFKLKKPLYSIPFLGKRIFILNKYYYLTASWDLTQTAKILMTLQIS